MPRLTKVTISVHPNTLKNMEEVVNKRNMTSIGEMMRNLFQEYYEGDFKTLYKGYNKPLGPTARETAKAERERAEIEEYNQKIAELVGKVDLCRNHPGAIPGIIIELLKSNGFLQYAKTHRDFSWATTIECVADHPDTPKDYAPGTWLLHLKGPGTADETWYTMDALKEELEKFFTTTQPRKK